MGLGAAVVGDVYVYWPFRAGSGSTVDDMSASGSRPGELSAAGVTWVHHSALGNTLSFDGSGDVRCGEDLAFFDTELSFEAFFICDSYSSRAQNGIFSVSAYAPYLAVTSTGHLFFEVEIEGGSGYASMTGPTVLQTGRLYHVAVSEDATAQTIRMYLDGVEEGVLTNTVSITLQDRTVIVGTGYNANMGFAGIIDEVRFYDRPLTAAEVLAHSRQVYLTGERGAVGATGTAGYTGSRGLTGVQGQTGTEGPQGRTGPRGETGTQGSTGLVGDTGPQGRTGMRGETGVVGAPGQTGPVGYTGPRGDTGPQGEDRAGW